jgi:hypothetical protein
MFNRHDASTTFDQPGTSASFNQPGTPGSLYSGDSVAASDRLHGDVLTLTSMFPDCDPAFLRSRLEENFGASDRVERVVEALLKAGDYPKLLDRRKTEYLAEQKRERLSQVIDFDDILRSFANPEAHFTDKPTRLAESYKQHARAYLQAVFGRGASDEIEPVLDSTNFHFLPAFRILKTHHLEMFTDRVSDRTNLAGIYGPRNFESAKQPPGRPTCKLILVRATAAQ